ncbi:MAG: tripartite tricarboxylate transporter substrate binding protein [Proteobacteria bacterium]|nr:tripartite tricarboxylate transporter substrate binding protein [Pseudomonadota bacterium]
MDILGRLVGAKLHEAWGQPVIVESKPGAGAIIGLEYVSHAAPDGYTLSMFDLGSPISVSLYKKLPFDLVRDFRPVAMIARTPFILVVHPSVPAQSLRELIALAKAEPGALSFGSAGVGVTSHLAFELLRSMAGIDLVHVPYKGQAPATQDLLSGQIQTMFMNPINGLPHVRDNRLRALAISTAARAPAAPEIPPVAEAGVPGFDVAIWFGMTVPAGVPREIVEKLAAEIARIQALPDVQKRLAELGAEPVVEGPAALAARVDADIGRWAAVIKTANVTAE